MNVSLSPRSEYTVKRADAITLGNSDELRSHCVEIMTRYCKRCWVNAQLPEDQHQDATQSVFERLLGELPINQWNTIFFSKDIDLHSSEGRTFRRILDTVKKRYQRERRYSELSDATEEYLDKKGQQQAILSGQWALVQELLPLVLTPRKRQILEMSREGMKPQEIASAIGIPARIVTDEKYKAICQLRQVVLFEIG